MKGINDLWTTDPEIASLLWNPEEGYSHLRRGKFYTDWKCPVCGKKIENINLAQITVERHVSCPTCSDSISYPNKFMFYLLEELGVERVTEYYAKQVYFKEMANPDIFVTVTKDQFTGQMIKRTRSTSELSVTEMRKAINRFREWSEGNGCLLPDATIKDDESVEFRSDQDREAFNQAAIETSKQEIWM